MTFRVKRWVVLFCGIFALTAFAAMAEAMEFKNETSDQKSVSFLVTTTGYVYAGCSVSLDPGQSKGCTPIDLAIRFPFGGNEEPPLYDVLIGWTEKGGGRSAGKWKASCSVKGVPRYATVRLDSSFECWGYE